MSVRKGATVHRLVSDGQSVSSSSVKTASNKIPVSSVLDDSEGLYGTTVSRCLDRTPHYFARLMRFGSCGPSQGGKTPPGLGVAMSTVALEKNREMLFIGNVFHKQ